MSFTSELYEYIRQSEARRYGNYMQTLKESERSKMDYEIKKGTDNWYKIYWDGLLISSSWGGPDGISAEKRARMVKFVHENWELLQNACFQLALEKSKWTSEDLKGCTISMTDILNRLGDAIRWVEEGNKPKVVRINIPVSSVVNEPNVQYDLNHAQARSLRDQPNKELGE